MKAAILPVDSAQPVYAVQAMTEAVAQSMAQRRVALVLLAFFAASALILAAIGVYRILSYSVTQRTGEIGIRIALGARTAQFSLLVGTQGMALVLAGLAVGMGGALWLTRWMGSLLFRVSPRDPPIFTAAAVLALVSAAACYLPARRAAKVDPIVALRRECRPMIGRALADTKGLRWKSGPNIGRWRDCLRGDWSGERNGWPPIPLPDTFLRNATPTCQTQIRV